MSFTMFRSPLKGDFIFQMCIHVFDNPKMFRFHYTPKHLINESKTCHKNICIFSWRFTLGQMKILLDVYAVLHKVKFHFLHVYIKIKPRIFMVPTFLHRHNLNHFKSLYITFNKAYIYGLWAATSCILAPQLLGWEPSPLFLPTMPQKSLHVWIIFAAA